MKLRVEPIVEAIWEVRFQGVEGVAIADVLPGMLYSDLKDEYPRSVQLPLGNFPAELLETDERLRYLPSLRLEASETSQYAIQIGERVLTFNNRKPYAGWSEFSRRARDLAGKIQATGLISKVERFALRYVDVIDDAYAHHLEGLNVKLQLGALERLDGPIFLRAEVEEGALLRIVRIVSPASATSSDEIVKGTMIDIDTIQRESTVQWQDLEGFLEEAHKGMKSMFFSFLGEDVINRLGPTYDERAS